MPTSVTANADSLAASVTAQMKQDFGLVAEPITLHGDMGWAAGTDHVARAWGSFVAAVERQVEPVLGVTDRDCVAKAVAAWNGADAALGDAWIDEALAGLEAGSRPAARLALLSALAPERAIASELEHRDALAAAAWGALAAARRVGSWLA